MGVLAFQAEYLFLVNEAKLKHSLESCALEEKLSNTLDIFQKFYFKSGYLG